MSKQTFKQGDPVFNGQGHKAEYIAKTPDGHIVRPAYVNYDYDDEYGYVGVDVWPVAFSEPPVAVVSEEISKLNKQAEELRVTIRALNESKLQLERDARDRVARIARHEKLQRLEDFLSGKITHYVEIDYGTIRITPIAATTCADDKRALRLLTLFGDTKGDVAWHLNKYRDGSGSWIEVIPCSSELEAVEAAKKCLDAAFEDWRSSLESYRLRQAVESAKKLGFEVPADAAAALRNTTLAILQKQLDDARKKSDDAIEAIAKLEGEAK